jgi:hypothetical protein
MSSPVVIVMLTIHDDSFLYFFLPVVPSGLFILCQPISRGLSIDRISHVSVHWCKHRGLCYVYSTTIYILLLLYVCNIHIQRQGAMHPDETLAEVMDVTVVAEDQKGLTKLCWLPSRSPSSHVSTSFTTNIYQRYAKGSKLASLSTFLCSRIYQDIYFSFSLLLLDRRSMDGYWLSPALHWSFSVDQLWVV